MTSHAQANQSAWLNARIATFNPQVSGEFSQLSGLHALIVDHGKIHAILSMDEFQADKFTGTKHDVNGAWITPGLIDCHTHIVFGGNRSKEWSLRLSGISYQELAMRGGGILSTVAATRSMSAKELALKAKRVLNAIAQEGVTCVEIKSGYGLLLEDEIKMLQAIQILKESSAIEISATYLAAHALPVEFKEKRAEYLDLICDKIIPEVARQKLAEAVDVFCEGIAFSVAECEQVFLAAKRNGLAIKGHMDQLSNLGGSQMACKHGAWSVDHLEYLNERDLPALKASGAVAVLLPGAFYTLKETQKPPVEHLRKQSIPIAIATDCNPGSSPFSSIRMAMNFGCVLFGLTAHEALYGATHYAAQALKRSDRIGMIKPGLEATFCVWDVEDPSAIVSDLTINPLRLRVIRGEAQSYSNTSFENL